MLLPHRHLGRPYTPRPRLDYRLTPILPGRRHRVAARQAYQVCDVGQQFKFVEPSI